jgi:hypothetical protein
MGINMRRIQLRITVLLLAIVVVVPGIPILAIQETMPTSHLTQVDYMMMVENTTGSVGEAGHVFRVNGSWTVAIKEYAIQLSYDKTKIDIATITLDGCVGSNPSSFRWTKNVTNGYITATVQKTGIPAGSGPLFNIFINISKTAPLGLSLLDLRDGINTRYIDGNGITHAPRTIDGYLTIIAGNQQPGQPILTGPDAAGAGILLNFSAVSTDPTGDQLFYQWDWGDGNISGWFGPYNSSELITTNHSWINETTYIIRVKAKDATGNESIWSENHSLEIAPQIQFKNIRPGFIYINFLTFNKSYFYVNLLDILGATIIISTNDLIVETTITNAVHTVHFEALDLLLNESAARNDTNSTDGFSCVLNLSRGLYQLTITAFDTNGTLIDGQIIPYVLFLRIGAGSTSIQNILNHSLKTRFLQH